MSYILQADESLSIDQVVAETDGDKFILTARTIENAFRQLDKQCGYETGVDVVLRMNPKNPIYEEYSQLAARRRVGDS